MLSFSPQDYIDTEVLLCAENVNQDNLLSYAREAADFATNYQLPSLDFALNHYGQPDVAMFDFTSMYASENAALVRERQSHQLLVALVGDSLLEVAPALGTPPPHSRWKTDCCISALVQPGKGQAPCQWARLGQAYPGLWLAPGLPCPQTQRSSFCLPLPALGSLGWPLGQSTKLVGPALAFTGGPLQNMYPLSWTPTSSSRGELSGVL